MAGDMMRDAPTEEAVLRAGKALTGNLRASGGASVARGGILAIGPWGNPHVVAYRGFQQEEPIPSWGCGRSFHTQVPEDGLEVRFLSFFQFFCYVGTKVFIIGNKNLSEVMDK